MGLDTVEIILRAEEVFAVDLPDQDCSLVITVGDFYRLILDKLKLPYQKTMEIENPIGASTIGRDRSQSQFPSIKAWNTPDVWITLKAIIQDQLGLEADKIHENARFVQDLRCD